MATGRVGAEDLAADTDTTVYQCPEGTFAAISATICNRSNEPILISLAVCAAETPEIYEYIEYETELHARGTFERTGIVLGEEKYLVARSNSANVNIVAYGIESLTAAYVPPTPSAPINTAAPVITGTADLGETLTVSTGTWSGFPTPTYTYQWYNGTSPISGATSSTYVPVVDDVGDILRCGVTATNTSGSSTALTEYTSIVTGILEWSRVYTLDNPNAYGTAAQDQFGQSVAVSGNYAIVGAPQEENIGTSFTGKAYIFNATTGALLHTLSEPDGTELGCSVAISGDNCIVGARGDVSGSGGKAYIYNVTTGALLYTLDNPSPFGTSAGDRFGVSVAIDGNRAIVGAYWEDDAGGDDSGKAYIYNVTTGALLHTLDNPSPFGTSAGDRFGSVVAISGNNCIVGAPNEDDAGGNTSGKAYIYNVTTGALLHTLDNPNAFDTSASDNFGVSLAIDGNYAIVGANFEDDAGGTDSGKAYIFSVTTGALLHTLDNPKADTGYEDEFGVSVAISGNYAIVGAIWEEDADGVRGAGSAYIFDVTTGDLVKTLDNPGVFIAQDFRAFGLAVSIDGNYAIVGAPYEDEPGNNTSGKAHIYQLAGIVTEPMTEPSLVFTLVNPNAFSSSDGDRFGFYADLDTDWIVVGADRETNAGGATWPGRVYVYDAATGALEHSIANPNIDPATEEFDSFGVAMAVWGNKAITSTVETVSVGVGHVIDLSTGTIDRQLVNPNNFSTPNTDRFAINGAMDLWGDVAIVGAYSEDATGAGDTGCAYLMDITDGSLLHTLANPSPGANDGMGEHVAICENYAVTGIPYFEGAGSNSGRVYVWSVSTGSLVYTLDNPDPDGLPNSDWFGSALAVTNTHLLVGTKNEDQTGANGGAAYIYDLSDGSLLYTLLNENAFGDAAGDIFGVAVALTPTHAYIGASQEDGTGASNTGKVYVYDLATGDLVFTIDNPNDNGAEDFDTFGTTIRVSSDYSRLLVTALGETDENTAVTGGGKVYVFDI